jgi:hypothetical protein
VFHPLIGLFFVGNAKLNPALCPAAFEYKPSTPGFHPGPEPEFPVPLNFTGLIRPFHENNSLAKAQPLWTAVKAYLYKGSCLRVNEM